MGLGEPGLTRPASPCNAPRPHHGCRLLESPRGVKLPRRRSRSVFGVSGGKYERFGSAPESFAGGMTRIGSAPDRFGIGHDPLQAFLEISQQTYPFDTTRAFMSLLFNGAFEDPRTSAGTSPTAAAPSRCSARAWPQRRPPHKEFGPLLGMPAGSALLSAESAHRALAASFYDTALIADPPALQAVAGVADAGHFLFGSDWPFAARMYAPEGDPQPALREVLGGEELEAVERAGALAQFGHLAGRPGPPRR